MKIHCPYCKQELMITDVVVLDKANGMAHFRCYGLGSAMVEEVGKYGTIKSKYDFLFKE